MATWRKTSSSMLALVMSCEVAEARLLARGTSGMGVRPSMAASCCLLGAGEGTRPLGAGDGGAIMFLVT